MKIIWKIFKGIAVALAILLISIALFIFSVLKWPEWLINPKTFRVVAPFASYFGVVIQWKDAQVQVTSKNLLHKTFYFSFGDLCLKTSNNQYQGCFDQVEFSGEIAWLEGGLKALSLGPIRAIGGDVSIRLKDEEKPKEEKSQGFDLNLPELVLPDFLRNTQFHEIKFELKRLFVHGNQQVKFLGSVDISASTDENYRLSKIDLHLVSESGYSAPSGNLDVDISSASHFLENDWILDGRTELTFDESRSLEADLMIKPIRPKSYSIVLSASTKLEKMTVPVRFEAVVGQGKVEGKFSVTLEGLEKPLQKIVALNCDLNLKAIENTGRFRVNVECPVLVDLSPLQLPSATLTHLVTIPQSLDLLLKIDTEANFSEALNKPIRGDLEVTLKAISERLVNADGTVKTEFEGVPSRYPEGWKILTNLDLRLLLPHFHELAKALDRTSFPVPAPFYPLHGEVKLHLTGQANIARQSGKIPIAFTTRLHSKEQSFDTDGQGEVDYYLKKSANNADLSLDLKLSDIKIHLPRFGYTSLPAIFPDSRFFNPRKTKPQKSKQNFSYHVHVATLPKKPIRLFSNITKENIPIYVDVNMDPEKLLGDVRIGLTELEFFRRNATIEKFRVRLTKPKELSEISGKIRVSYADYQIYIKIMGTIEKPKIIFESNPPLNQDEIISVLIFGRPYDNLSATQANSVASVSSAAAERGIALASLFLLASTPIESVDYNPSTGAFSAKIRLAQGTSLTLGTVNGQTQQVGLRKNLGGNWIINTYLENNSKAAKQSGGAYIEYYKRY